MHAAVVMWPPAPGLPAATALQPGDARLPVCLPPQNGGGEPTAPPPFWPRCRPPVWGVPPLPRAVHPGRRPHHRANGLLKSRRVS
jgi:hypothetical protein